MLSSVPRSQQQHSYTEHCTDKETNTLLQLIDMEALCFAFLHRKNATRFWVFMFQLSRNLTDWLQLWLYKHTSVYHVSFIVWYRNMFINAFVFHNQTSVSLSESENFNVLFSDRSSDSESSKPIKIHTYKCWADEYKLNLQILIFLVYCFLSTHFVSRPPRSQAVLSQTSGGRTGNIPHSPSQWCLQ